MTDSKGKVKLYRAILELLDFYFLYGSESELINFERNVAKQVPAHYLFD